MSCNVDRRKKWEDKKYENGNVRLYDPDGSEIPSTPDGRGDVSIKSPHGKCLKLRKGRIGKTIYRKSRSFDDDRDNMADGALHCGPLAAEAY